MVKGNPPSPRDSHSCTTVGNNLYVFGGTDGKSPLKDLHILDTCKSCFLKWLIIIFPIFHFFFGCSSLHKILCFSFQNVAMEFTNVIKGRVLKLWPVNCKVVKFSFFFSKIIEKSEITLACKSCSFFLHQLLMNSYCKIWQPWWLFLIDVCEHDFCFAIIRFELWITCGFNMIEPTESNDVSKCRLLASIRLVGGNHCLFACKLLSLGLFLFILFCLINRCNAFELFLIMVTKYLILCSLVSVCVIISERSYMIPWPSVCMVNSTLKFIHMRHMVWYVDCWHDEACLG